MKKEYYYKVLSAAIIVFSLLSTDVCAEDIVQALGGVNNMLYGVAAGFATLMLTFHAIRWKLAGSPAEREEAKRGMINVVLGLIIIILAATIVSMVYVKPPEAAPGGEATTTTTPQSSAGDCVDGTVVGSCSTTTGLRCVGNPPTLVSDSSCS